MVEWDGSVVQVPVLAALLGLATLLSVQLWRVVTGRTGAKSFRVVVPENTAMKEGFNNDRGTHIFHKHVQVGSLLGFGSVGKVYRGRYRGTDVVIKVLACKTSMEKAEQDMPSLGQLRHPSLVLYMGMTSPKEGQVCLVSEFMPRGSLSDVLQDEAVQLSWQQRVRMVLSTAQALLYLHEAGEVHMAVSSSNVMVNDELQAKLADYGMAAMRRSVRNGQHQARPVWSAPEVLKSDKHSRASDVYSLGMVLWEAVTRLPLYSHAHFPSQVALVKAILAGERPPLPGGAPASLGRLLSACWNASPSRRPSAAEVVRALESIVQAHVDPAALLAVRVDKQQRRKSTLAPPGGEGGAARAGGGRFLQAMDAAGMGDQARWRIDASQVAIESLIGEGSMGKVFQGTYLGKKVAVKKIRHLAVPQEQLEDIVNEIRVMCSLRHPNTVLFLGAFEDEQHLSIVMEFCDRGSLGQVLRDTSQHVDYSMIVRMLTDVAQGMNYLHLSQPAIIHRDLKSANVLVDADWACKVSDFGLTRFASDEDGATARNAGTPFWTAPEAMEDGTFTARSDVYSFGVVVWEMFTRQVPFSDMNAHQAALAVMTQDLRPEIPTFVPPRFDSLIRRCWARDPAARPTFQQVLAELEVIRTEGLPRLELSLGCAKLYRKRHPVFAFRSRDVVTVYKKWGTGTSQRGDYVVVGPGDDVYTCAADIFQRTYEPVPGRRNVYRKSATVLALRIDRAFLIETLEGSEHGVAGDYLAQNPVDGEQWPISGATFADMYEEVPADELAAEAAKIAERRSDTRRTVLLPSNTRQANAAAFSAVRTDSSLS